MQLEYLSETSGIGGRIKERIDDFEVEEVMKDGTVLRIGEKITREVGESECGNARVEVVGETTSGSSGENVQVAERESEDFDFVHFVLQKTNWNTLQAIDAVARALHVTKKRFNYAGSKDRRAVTTQLVSAFKLDCARLASVKVKDIQINGCWKAQRKIDLGDLKGNRFKIAVRGVCENAEEKVKKINEELNGFFPNYFGEQRFGSMRSNTHLVGRAVVQGNFKEAVENYLTYSGEEEETVGAVEARKRLKLERDFGAALNYFPMHLKYERTLLAHLAQHSNDYVNAMRKLPRGLNLMFVHAYQSFLFNELLSERIKEMKRDGRKKVEAEEGERVENKVDVIESEKQEYSFVYGKLIGSETTNLSEREKKVLEREGVEVEAFKIPSFPEIGSKGSERLLLAQFENFESERVAGEQANNAGVVRLCFTLQAGCYATVLLDEFTDEKANGFKQRRTTV
ncbi:tRNA pseudouridine(13) synthase TruD [Candidatus Micrarchaeota archaeon]|nr:tRNA pseudouridine(13) synthase TruD [Candidatus Micrarchaeota archaeon]